MTAYKMETNIFGTPNLILAHQDYNCDDEAIQSHKEFNAMFLTGVLVSQRLFKKVEDEWVLVWDNPCDKTITKKDLRKESK